MNKMHGKSEEKFRHMCRCVHGEIGVRIRKELGGWLGDGGFRGFSVEGRGGQLDGLKRKYWPLKKNGCRV